MMLWVIEAYLRWPAQSTFALHGLREKVVEFMALVLVLHSQVDRPGNPAAAPGPSQDDDNDSENERIGF